MFSLVRYIKALHSYLLSFTKRAQPLVDVATLQKEAEAQFGKQWEAGEIEGWEETKEKPSANGAGSGEGIWCSACESQYVVQSSWYSYLYRPEDVLKTNGLRRSLDIEEARQGSRETS